MTTDRPIDLSADRLELELDDRKPQLSVHEALAEANRCLYCSDAPCIPSCPTAIDIPEFIRQISTGNLLGSAKTILDANILGYSCARVCPVEVLCEGTCVYNELGEKPIQIGRLQRVATEVAYAEGARFFEAGTSTGKKVAIVGAGPAGLACAHELRIQGHEVVIFEGREIPGGLNSTGVAPYKLQAEDSIRELEYVLGIGGVELRTGVWIGRDVAVQSLEADFDAVFVGAGLGPDGALDIPGKDLEGVVGAVAWIEQMKLDPSYTLPEGLEDVAIIGGGNTAIDVVREMAGLGVRNVRMVYRRDEASMSGYAHEWKYAKIEGASGVWFAQPVAFVDDGNGRVAAVRCLRTETGPDGRLATIAGSEFEVPAQLVTLAVGQSKLEAMFSGIDGIEFQWGRFVIDDETGQTGNSKFFAGGDCANGGKEVVNASAEGKRAARGIDAMLRA